MRALLRAEIKLHNASVLGNCLPAENAPDKKKRLGFRPSALPTYDSYHERKKLFPFIGNFLLRYFLGNFLLRYFFLGWHVSTSFKMNDK
jgi:hypothetical protein